MSLLLPDSSQRRGNSITCSILGFFDESSVISVSPSSSGSGRSLCTADDLPRIRRRLHSQSSCREFSDTPRTTSNHLVHECAWRHVVGGTRMRALAVVWWWMERSARRSSCTRAPRPRCKVIAPPSFWTESFSHAFSTSVRVRLLSRVAPWTTKHRSTISVTIALRDVLFSVVANIQRWFRRFAFINALSMELLGQPNRLSGHFDTSLFKLRPSSQTTATLLNSIQRPHFMFVSSTKFTNPEPKVPTT